MTTLLTEQEKQAISDAIEDVEKRTSGELVAIIADTSDDYLYIPLLWASLIALSLPGVWFLLNYGWGDFSQRLYEIQVLVFAVLALFFQWPPIKRWLIPGAVMQDRAAKLARQEFLTLGLHSTQNRAAILIFVSVAEHYVEVLVDKGIHEKVPEGTWDEIVQEFIRYVKQKHFAQGYQTAITRCGDVLIQHFPQEDSEENKLPNHLIEL